MNVTLNTATVAAERTKLKTTRVLQSIDMIQNDVITLIRSIKSCLMNPV